MRYLGDFVIDDVDLTFHWNTFDAVGASVTRATNGTIKVIRDDDTDCTGTSVTDAEDSPDVGIHKCKIDLSDGADYIAGHDYTVWLDGAVIDGHIVNACLAQFSIQNRCVNSELVDIAARFFAGKKVVRNDANKTIKVYDEDGVTLLYTFTQTADGNDMIRTRTDV